MADVGESLDLLAFLDGVADETVSQLVHELGPPSVSCGLGDRDTLDLLSMCDTASLPDSMANSSQAEETEADDRYNHVRSKRKELSSADDKYRTLRPRRTEASSFPVVKKGCDSQCTSFSTTNILSARHSSVVLLQLTPSTEAHVGQTISQQDPGPEPAKKSQSRMLFSKTQRQQLDAVFQKTMYPSKWRITELARNLQVPVRSIRNRRWRLRKSHGISGNQSTRGSRTMLPDADDTPSKGQLSAPVNLGKSNEASNPCNQKIGSAATRTSTLKKLKTPSASTSATAATSRVSTTVPFSTAASASSYTILSSTDWLHSNTAKSGDKSPMDSSPGSVTNWYLPSVYWPTEALRLSPYQSTSPLQHCCLPLLQGPYSATPAPLCVGQSLYSDVGKQTVGSAPSSSFRPLSQTSVYSDRARDCHYFPSTLYSSEKLEPAVFSCSPSSFVQPYVTLNASSRVENSVHNQTRTAPVSAYRWDSNAKWGGMEYHSCQNPLGFTGQPVHLGSMAATAGSTDAFTTAQFQPAQVAQYSSSVNLSSLQASYLPGMYQGFSSTQVWAQLAPPLPLPYSGFDPAQLPYQTNLYPTVHNLAGSQFSPNLHELGSVVSPPLALPVVAASRGALSSHMELQANRMELHSTELQCRNTVQYPSSNFTPAGEGRGAEQYKSTGTSSRWAELHNADKAWSIRGMDVHMDKKKQSSSRVEMKSTWKQQSSTGVGEHIQSLAWGSAEVEMLERKEELGSGKAGLPPTMAEAGKTSDQKEVCEQETGLNSWKKETNETETSLVQSVCDGEETDESEELDVTTVSHTKKVGMAVTRISNQTM